MCRDPAWSSLCSTWSLFHEKTGFWLPGFSLLLGCDCLFYSFCRVAYTLFYGFPGVCELVWLCIKPPNWLLESTTDTKSNVTGLSKKVIYGARELKMQASSDSELRDTHLPPGSWPGGSFLSSVRGPPLFQTHLCTHSEAVGIWGLSPEWGWALRRQAHASRRLSFRIQPKVDLGLWPQGTRRGEGRGGM